MDRLRVAWLEPLRAFDRFRVAWLLRLLLALALLEFVEDLRARVVLVFVSAITGLLVGLHPSDQVPHILAA